MKLAPLLPTYAVFADKVLPEGYKKCHRINFISPSLLSLFCRMTISACRSWTSWASSMVSRPISPTRPCPRSWRSCATTSGGRSRRSSKSKRAPRTSEKLPKIRRVSPTSTASWESPTRNWLNYSKSSKSSNHKYSCLKSSRPTQVCQVRKKMFFTKKRLAAHSETKRFELSTFDGVFSLALRRAKCRLFFAPLLLVQLELYHEIKSQEIAQFINRAIKRVIVAKRRKREKCPLAISA